MPASSPRISVVIPTLGNYEGLNEVLSSYERQTTPASDFELVVVADQADPDPGAVDAVVDGRSFPVARITGHRPGASANRNAGVREARSDLVLFTDNDTIAHPDLLAQHLEWHRREPDESTGVVGHVRWAPAVKVTSFMRWLDHGIQFDYPNITGVDAGWARFYSANASVKRGLFERVGGFDEARLPYLYEDLDFGLRANEIGFKLLYNRRAIVDHLRVMDLEFWRSKVGRLAQAERAFTSKHPEIPPHFQRLFEDAAKAPRARGLGRHLLRWVPRSMPLIGWRVWFSADMYYRQAIAPDFLKAWEKSAMGSSGTR
jgi:GT2 family glycosyltransferase